MRLHTFPVNGEALPVYVAERPTDLRDFADWCAAQREPIAVDTETQGLKIYSTGPTYLRLVQFGTDREAWVIPAELGEPFREAARSALKRLPELTGHNWHSFDALVLAEHLGLDLDMLCHKALDTMVLAKLLDPRATYEGGIGAALKPLSAHFIDPAAPDTQGDLTAVFRSLKLTKETGWAGIDLWHPTYLSYAGGDVLLTAALRKKLLVELTRVGARPVLIPYEHEIARICAHMVKRGMLLDTGYAHKLSEDLGATQDQFSTIAARYGVDNVNRSATIGEALRGMGETLTRTSDKTGALTVDKTVLSELADMDLKGNRLGIRTPNPLADAVIRSKRAGKWRVTYADTFISEADANGRIHPFINTLQARTGRMSVTRPALQTLPGSDWIIRRALLAEPGHRTISVDFAAIEMRVLAALADVKMMKHAINTGQDLHDFTARLVFGDGFTKAHRKLCKGIGFGTVYGGGAPTIQRQTGAPMEQVVAARAAYGRAYPEIKRASGRWQREARAQGMVTISATGRRLPLDRDRTYAVVNYMCQSAARDCLGQALIDMDTKGLTPYLRLPIHDEVLASAPEAEAAEIGREIESCMTFNLFGVDVAAGAEIFGRSWGSGYLKDAKGNYDPALMIAQDAYWADHPAEAWAKAA